MFTFRTRTTALAAAGTAVLALALTACGDGGSDAKSAGPGTGSSAPAAASAPSTQDSGAAKGGGTTGGGTAGGGTADTAGSAQRAQTGTGKDSGGTKATGAAKASTGAATASTRACTPKDVAISAAHQDGPPYTHIVLTAKNTSGKSCRLNGFPEIQFLESHREDVPAVAKSKPAAPVVLTPGAPAYALVRVSGGGVDDDIEPVTAFSVTLQGSSDVVAVTAPGADGIAVDPAAWATGYWTPQLRNGADDF